MNRRVKGKRAYYPLRERRGLEALCDKKAVWYAAFNHDGKKIVTASADKTAKVWDANSGDLLFTLGAHPKLVRFAYFSDDGKKVITMVQKKSWEWDAATGDLLRAPK